MSRQVTYYALSADLRELEAKISTVEQLAYVKTRSKTAEPEMYPVMENAIASQWWAWLLVRPCDVSSLVLEERPDLGYWTVENHLVTRTIEYNMSVQDHTLLRRGRLYFANRLAGRGAADFGRIADQILQVARRHFIRHNGEYVGEHALAWLQRTPGAKLSII